MAEVLLSIKGVEVRRGMSVVLSSFGLEVNSGDITVIHGANGSGKSTVIETAARLLPLEKGQVSHHQQMTMHSDGRRKKPVKPFGLTLQSNGVIGSETIENHLRTVAALSEKEVDLAPLLESYDIKHRTQDIIAHLSGGQQRKVAVLAGLLPAMISREPTLVLLDEPDAGLDDAAITTLTQHIVSLASAGHGFLIASHNPSLRKIGTRLHNLTGEEPGVENKAKPWETKGQPKQARNVLVRTGHRYASSTHAGLARNGLAAMMILGCMLALGDPSILPSGLWLTGGILAPAFASGLAGDPTSHLMQEARANDWWRSQVQRTPSALGLGVLIGGIVTAGACYVYINEIDIMLVLIGAMICEATMSGVRFLHASTQRLARPNAVFIRLLLPAFILPWALIVSWAAGR